MVIVPQGHPQNRLGLVDSALEESVGRTLRFVTVFFPPEEPANLNVQYLMVVYIIQREVNKNAKSPRFAG